MHRIGIAEIFMKLLTNIFFHIDKYPLLLRHIHIIHIIQFETDELCNLRQIQ